MKTEPVFWICEKEGVVCFKVAGKGSFQNAPLLKKAVQKSLDEGKKQFLFEMAECAGMDSTFLGVLSGVALKAKGIGGAVSLAGLEGRNLELVENMGLGRLVSVIGAGDLPGAGGSAHEPVAPEKASKSEINSVMLEAHRTLISIDERNLPKFQDVVEYLSKEEPRSGA